jgi:hypothetical protein
MVGLDTGGGLAAFGAGDLEPGLDRLVGDAVAGACGPAWIWLNPRLFPEPRTLDAWMSRGVLGERVLPGASGGVPAGHVRAAKRVLSWLSLPGAGLMVWGLWALWWEGAVFGMILALLPKLWFLDRMVWIHRDWVAAGRRCRGMEDERMEGRAHG